MSLKALVQKSVPAQVIKPFRLGYMVLKANLQDFRTNPPVLIYSMPKAGTSTVMSTLQGVDLASIFKAHRLSYEGLKQSEEKRQTHKNPKVLNADSVPRVIRKKIDQDPQIRWKIITLTREPIAQAVSRLFQGIDNQQPQLIAADGSVKLDEAIAFLQHKFATFDESSNPEKIWYDLVWFDRELLDVFKVDIYNHPYDHANGFTLIRADRVDVLAIRAEDLNTSLEVGLAKFLELKYPPKMHRSNVGEEKQLQAAYKYVKDNVVVPLTDCEKIYSTKYARHFYTEAERAQLTEKWSKAR